MKVWSWLLISTSGERDQCQCLSDDIDSRRFVYDFVLKYKNVKTLRCEERLPIVVGSPLNCHLIKQGFIL